ncbi:MAG: hypothetical protein ACOH2R_08520 [Pseudomonas sp.]
MSKSSAVSDVDQQWKVEQDLRTLADAIEINKDPKRLAAVKALAKQKSAEMASIAK